MSKVYFKTITEYDEPELAKIALELFDEVVKEEKVELAGEIPIKVHFGEKDNTTFLRPACYQGVIGRLKEQGITPSYIETNVLYRGSRTTRDSHIALAREHGFTDLPILIADGDHGEEVMDVAIPGEIFESVKLGNGFAPYDQFIVMAHFKGHAEAGFGGAMKQLAMGFAARPGKMAQHATVNPIVTPEECIACGACVQACNYDAIELTDTAFIDHEKCVGCAACVAVCPVGAIRTDWSARDFTLRLAEYAYGAGHGKRNIYISFALNITEFCDCYGGPMEPVAGNLGVFCSTDPVAIDTACIDMLQAKEGKPVFDMGRESLAHAEKLGLGSRSYELITMDR